MDVLNRLSQSSIIFCTILLLNVSFLIDLCLFQKLLCSGHPGSHFHCSSYVCNNASHEHVQWESSAAGKNVACSVNFTNSGGPGMNESRQHNCIVGESTKYFKFTSCTQYVEQLYQGWILCICVRGGTDFRYTQSC